MDLLDQNNLQVCTYLEKKVHGVLNAFLKTYVFLGVFSHMA